MRPIQEKLNLDTVSTCKSSIVQKCVKCFVDVPLNELRSHSLTCKSTKTKTRKRTISDTSDDSDNEPEPVKKRKKNETPIPHYNTNFDSDSTDEIDLPKPPINSAVEIPDDMTSCPVCDKRIKASEINEHLDNCLASEESKTMFCGSNVANEHSYSLPQSNRIPPAGIRSPKSFLAELKDLQRDFMQKKAKTFSVRYSHIFDDSMTKMKIFFGKSELTPISVDFPGEKAVNLNVGDGGPHRELFSKIFEDAPQALMNGMEFNYVFQNDIHKLEKKNFFVYGQFVALALLMGCPGPHNFSKAFIENLLDIPTSFLVEDIPDFEVQEKLKLVIDNRNDQEKLDALIADFPERFEAG